MVKKKNSQIIFNENQHQARRLNRRRLQDIRIWQRICQHGFELAAVRLCRGFGFICRGGRLQTCSWSERISRSYNPDGGDLSENTLDFLLRCKKDYLAWVNQCVDAGVKYQAAIEILFFGRGTEEVEKIYCRRHGWAMTNLLQCLELYRK